MLGLNYTIGTHFGQYKFTPGIPGSGTIALLFMPSVIVQENIRLIVDATTGITLYSPVNSATSITLLNNVITLMDTDTSLMSSTDSLMILVDIPLDVQDQFPMAVAPYLTGQRPASQGFPVAFANEDILDYMPPQPISAMAPPINTILAFQDCSQYRSVALQIDTGAGISAGILTFEGSNTADSVSWAPVLLTVATTGVLTMSSTITLSASTNAFYKGPVDFRYFRVRVSTAVAGGIVGVYPLYRMSTFDGHQSVNIAQWGGTALTAGADPPMNIAQLGGTTQVNAGVAGTQAIGGNVAPGTTPTLNPIPIGGINPANQTTRVLTDNYGQQQVVGPDSAHVGITQPVLVAHADEKTGRLNSAEVMEYMLAELQLLNDMIHALPEVLNAPNGAFGFGINDYLTNVTDRYGNQQ